MFGHKVLSVLVRGWSVSQCVPVKLAEGCPASLKHETIHASAHTLLVNGGQTGGVLETIISSNHQWVKEVSWRCIPPSLPILGNPSLAIPPCRRQLPKLPVAKLQSTVNTPNTRLTNDNETHCVKENALLQTCGGVFIYWFFWMNCWWRAEKISEHRALYMVVQIGPYKWLITKEGNERPCTLAPPCLPGKVDCSAKTTIRCPGHGNSLLAALTTQDHTRSHLDILCNQTFDSHEKERKCFHAVLRRVCAALT